VAERLYQPPVLVVVEASFTSREDQDLGARVPEDKEFHVPAETVAEPFMVLAIHLPYLKSRKKCVPKQLLLG
jgi:hypothetical protein